MNNLLERINQLANKEKIQTLSIEENKSNKL